MADLRIYSLKDQGAYTRIANNTVDLTGDETVLIRGHNKAVLMIEQTGGNPISLDMCVIKNGSASRSGDEIDLLEVGTRKLIVTTFDDVESNTFTLSSEDSEGNYITHSFGARMIEYIPLTCNASASTIDASGNAIFTCKGNFFNGSFGARSNTLELEYTYRKKGGDWSIAHSIKAEDIIFSGNTYVGVATPEDLDYESSYEVMFMARDAFYSKGSLTSDVTSKPVFHWGKDDVTFEVPVYFEKGLEVSGGIETDKINGKPVAFPEYGTWTPGFSANCVFTKQQGWYSKVGNVVTVGFYMKVNCTSAGVIVLVTGLPYTPSMSAAGGGMCSGATVSAGFNFQCFVAETSGYISTRVQACNNTTAGALSTSASGITTTAGEMTLSGTITYMTN